MSEWISVEDRLPEFKEMVLLYCEYKVKKKKHYFMSMGFLDRIEKNETGQLNKFKSESEKEGKVIFWMIPEPPK